VSRVRLRVKTLGHKAGSVVEVDEATAASLVENHHATHVAPEPEKSKKD